MSYVLYVSYRSAGTPGLSRGGSGSFGTVHVGTWQPENSGRHAQEHLLLLPPPGWAFLVHAARAFRLRKFRGPLSLPLVGNLYDPACMAVITYIRKMTKIHGKMFTFWPGMSPMLVCSEPQAVRQILTDTKAFVKGSDYTEKFSVVFGTTSPKSPITMRPIFVSVIRLN